MASFKMELDAYVKGTNVKNFTRSRGKSNKVGLTANLVERISIDQMDLMTHFQMYGSVKILIIK